MTTAVTKESLAARIAELESGPRSLKEDYTLAAYKMLLATMEADPVAWTSEEAIAEVYCDETGAIGPKYMVGDIALYRHAQPAPVVPDEATAEDCPAFVKYDVTGVDEAWACGFNACRASMLAAGHQEKKP